MVADEPYLPSIIRDVVGRVDEFFSTRDEDPFEVKFGHGLYSQVGNDLVKSKKLFLMIWLMMPFDEFPGDEHFFGKVSCDIMIAIPTEANYSQEQREAINYHPRLKPLLAKFLEELETERKLGFF